MHGRREGDAEIVAEGWNSVSRGVKEILIDGKKERKVKIRGAN